MWIGGEEPLVALRREVREEVGVTDFEPQHVLTYLFESERERELVYVYKTVYDGPVVPSGELDGGRFWTLREIAEGVGGGIFTPQFRRRDPPCGGAAGCRALSPRFRSLRLFGTQGGLPSGDR